MNIFSLLRRLSSFQIIVLSFALLIGSGTLLLMTPWATQDGQGAALLPACFTAVSASCVTGLTVVDTASYWSHFGQLVILMLIQVGGLGVRGAVDPARDPFVAARPCPARQLGLRCAMGGGVLGRHRVHPGLLSDGNQVYTDSRICLQSATVSVGLACRTNVA